MLVNQRRGYRQTMTSHYTPAIRKAQQPQCNENSIDFTSFFYKFSYSRGEALRGVGRVNYGERTACSGIWHPANALKLRPVTQARKSEVRLEMHVSLQDISTILGPLQDHLKTLDLENSLLYSIWCFRSSLGPPTLTEWACARAGTHTQCNLALRGHREGMLENWVIVGPIKASGHLFQPGSN